MKLIILGNKTDIDEKREVKMEDVRAMCEQKNISYL